MKIRDGFVSNSSSSSFLINKKDLTEKQIEQVRDWRHEWRDMSMDVIRHYDWDAHADYANDWDTTETDKEFKFSTHMDNFDLRGYFNEIGIKDRFIHEI